MVVLFTTHLARHGKRSGWYPYSVVKVLMKLIRTPIPDRLGIIRLPRWQEPVKSPAEIIFGIGGNSRNHSLS